MISRKEASPPQEVVKGKTVPAWKGGRAVTHPGGPLEDRMPHRGHTLLQTAKAHSVAQTPPACPPAFSTVTKPVVECYRPSPS